MFRSSFEFSDTPNMEKVWPLNFSLGWSLRHISYIRLATNTRTHGHTHTHTYTQLIHISWKCVSRAFLFSRQIVREFFMAFQTSLSVKCPHDDTDPRRVYFLILLRRSLLVAQISLNFRKRGAKWLITMHAGMRGAVIGMRMTPRRPRKSSERKKR